MCKACLVDGRSKERHGGNSGGRPRGPDRKIDSRGYIQVRVPDGPYAHDWILEHRLITGAKSGQIVHHIDGNKQNNDPANLQVYDSISDHLSHHYPKGSPVA